MSKWCYRRRSNNQGRITVRQVDLLDLHCLNLTSKSLPDLYMCLPSSLVPWFRVKVTPLVRGKLSCFSDPNLKKICGILPSPSWWNTVPVKPQGPIGRLPVETSCCFFLCFFCEAKSSRPLKVDFSDVIWVFFCSENPAWKKSP